ncbi:IQ motif and SEC7 domain-containing protein 2 isoform X2 [Chanodichthys erythropterus]|uniref:IQ motif and SEC7 domain-containing protein 2 isoform X2 n=1 Tax=Chanodichthys erythropterus TaxID=933992 RepID=UPI00351E3078
MDSRTENPTKAAGYLKELNKIIETQQTLLERQKRRIFELEQHVSDLCAENSRLRHEYQRHLLTCRLRSVRDNSPQQQSEYGSTRIVRRHTSLPVEVTDIPNNLRSAVCRRTVPSRQWTSATLGTTLHTRLSRPSSDTDGTNDSNPKTQEVSNLSWEQTG